MKRAVFFLFFVLFISGYGLLGTELWRSQAAVRLDAPTGYVLPSWINKILALEHNGLKSDYLMLSLITFYGEHSMAQKKLDESDWRYVANSLDAITDLDPMYRDAYLFGESLFAWDAGEPSTANILLLKGMEARPTDWVLPFYAGANSLLFLKDNAAASRFFMQAAELPECPSFVGTLAARTGYYAGQNKAAIMFLEGLLAETEDPNVRKKLTMRRDALAAADSIERAVARYRQELGMMPDELQELVDSGFLQEMPEDPYGGEWIMVQNGRVFSTSKFATGTQSN